MTLRSMIRRLVYLVQDLKSLVCPPPFSESMHRAVGAADALADAEAEEEVAEPLPNYRADALQALEDALWCFTHNDVRFFCKDRHTDSVAVAADPSPAAPVGAGVGPPEVSAPPAPSGGHPSFPAGLEYAAGIVGAEAQKAWRTYLDSPHLNPAIHAQDVCQLLDRITGELREHAQIFRDQ